MVVMGESAISYSRVQGDGDEERSHGFLSRAEPVMEVDTEMFYHPLLLDVSCLKHMSPNLMTISLSGK